MNSNTLKTAGSIVLSVLLLVVIVIYIPKPEPRSSKRRPSFKAVNTEYLKLANQALSKANEISEITLQQMEQLIDEEKMDLSPLTAVNTTAINALAEADKSIKLCNEELEKFKEEEPSPTILIEANIKLSAALNDVSEIVKTLNAEVQNLKKENAELSPLFIEKVADAIKKLTDAIRKGNSALHGVINAFSEYYELGAMGER